MFTNRWGAFAGTMTRSAGGDVALLVADLSVSPACLHDEHLGVWVPMQGRALAGLGLDDQKADADATMLSAHELARNRVPGQIGLLDHHQIVFS